MKNIVLAYDGSAGAKRALERTANLANGAKVTVMSGVYVMPQMGRAAAAIDTEERDARRHDLEEASAYFAERGIKPEAIEFHAMDVGRALVDEAKEKGADLIVVGSNGKSFAERMLLGSVSTKVVHEANCDVLVVR